METKTKAKSLECFFNYISMWTFDFLVLNKPVTAQRTSLTGNTVKHTHAGKEPDGL